ncbi:MULTISPECIES: hypothetical protein [unclassified Sphingomonas]|uniref:hypothetical protein n=1 Tax=unclassified Sphingomonas TaxID=196159 RepID=UPI000BD29DBE|nr:MAG: hypothetical protein B7Y98_10125 [Sphingomonas sp. 32-62-10]
MNRALLRPGPTALAIALTALSGCVAPTQRYPSLLPRAIESRPAIVTVPADPSATVIPPDPAIDTEIARLTQALATIADAFTTATTRATNAVQAAKGAAIGSETWLSAQSALSGLDTLRSQSLSALSDLDRLAIDRATASQPPYPALTAARAKAEAQLTAELATVDSLQGQVAAF